MLEKQLDLSIDEDVMPWIGQVGVAVLDTKPGDPSVAFLAQERDLCALTKCSKNIIKAQTHEGSVKWKDTDYHGITIRTTHVTAPYGGAPNMTISIATIRRWMIVGLARAIRSKNSSMPGRDARYPWRRAPLGQGSLATSPGSVLVSTTDSSAPP